MYILMLGKMYFAYISRHFDVDRRNILLNLSIVSFFSTIIDEHHYNDSDGGENKQSGNNRYNSLFHVSTGFIVRLMR